MPEEPPEELPIDGILPPEVKSASRRAVDATTPEASEVSRILARWLDNWIRIPGTNFKIGIDPILSQVPGIGDFLMSSAGLVILLEGVRLRVSPFVLAHMGINLLINSVFNLIPGFGAIGSAIYKSNARNLDLIRRWQEGQAGKVRRGSLFFLLNLLLLLAVVVALWVGLWLAYLWLFVSLWNRFVAGSAESV